jgi:N-acetylmuramoyl-L-alanine amidase
MTPRGRPTVLTESRALRRRAQQRRRQRQRLAVLGGLCAAAIVIAALFAWPHTTPGRAKTPSARLAQATPTDWTTTTVTGSQASSQANETLTRAGSGRPTARAAGLKAQLPLSGKTIAIDPGHNGGNYLHTAEINRLVNAGTLHKPCDTTGTETDTGYSEAAYNLDVALRLRTVLRAEGARVVMTRTTNTGWGPCITERAAIGNNAHADAAISIHADGGPANGRGFHVIYPPSIPGLTNDIAANSYKLALAIRNAFKAGTGLPYATYIGHDGLDERSDLGGLNLSNVPKVFIETGNMRNATDAALLTTPSFRQREARALAAGLTTYLTT